MKFVAKLTHSADNCWARDEHGGKVTQLVERLDGAEESLGVSVLGAYVAPNEHTFYFVLESDSFESVTSLLGPPLLQDHTADVVPVTTFGDATAAIGVE